MARRAKTRQAGRWVWAQLCLLVLLAGCSQPGFQATSLPPQFQAPVVLNSQRLNLSSLAQATVRSDVIEPGDVLEITIATGLDKEGPAQHFARVAENGMINASLIGTVYVADMGLQQAEYAVGQACVDREIYRNPQVTIRRESQRTNHVKVIGAVEAPGDYHIPASGSDLLAALVAAGGLSEEAGMVVEIQRPAGGGVSQVGYQGAQSNVAYQASTVSLANPLTGSETDLRLTDGSVVMVPTRAPHTIYVTGLVTKSDGFEVAPDKNIRLLDALALAGGRKLEIADRVKIIRQIPNQPEPITIGASVREAKQNGLANIRLAPGDVVHVEETPTTFVLDTLRISYT